VQFLRQPDAADFIETERQAAVAEGVLTSKV
jgi:hypothetical protein